MFNYKQTIFILIFTKVVIGQSFLYNPGETHSQIELDNFVAPTGTIQNISDDSLSLAVVRTELFLPTDWTNKLCFGGICFPPEWDSLATTSADAPFYQEPIPPDSTIYFSVWFTAFSEYEGTATATIKIFDLNNPDDIIIQTHMASTYNFIVVNVLNDWNLVGLPLSVEDAGYSTIFPDAIPGTLYGFSDTYYQTQELEEGVGYWLRFENGETSAIFGESIPDLSLDLNADWNLITGISDTIMLNQIEDPNGIIIPGTLFGFNGTYNQSSYILPGHGYWVRTTEAGEITLTSDLMITNKFNYFDRTQNANIIEINGQKLFFGISIPNDEILSYSLPPKPPIGAFDARFDGDRTVINKYGIIEIMNPDESLIISSDLSKVEGNWILKNPETGIKYQLEGEGNITIEGQFERLILEKAKDRSTPKSFQLVKVFPNPFNPVTNISFSLLNGENLEQFVSIKIFDLTGKMVKELFTGNMKNGEHKIQWDGTNNFDTHVSAGIYLLNVNTNTLSHSEKLLFLK